MKGSPTKNLPAAATCVERGWGVGTVLCSERWSKPRVLEDIKGAFVTLSTFRGATVESKREHRADGTFAEMHGACGGRKPFQLERVRSFPPDVRRYNTFVQDRIAAINAEKAG